MTDDARPNVRSPKRAEAWAKRAQAGVRGLVAGLPLVFTGTTLNAASQAVDTGFKPPANTAAKLDGGLSVVDVAAHTTSSKNINAAVRNFGGLAIAGAPTVAGTTGDASLATATVAFSVSGGGTLVATFTPPALYVGTLDYVLFLNPTLNP